MNSVANCLGVDKVHVWRGDLHVLRGVSLQVNPGELVHVAGPNGTGKSTLLRVITGLLQPEQGAVTWCSRAIDRFRAEYQAQLTYLSHEPALKGDLTALENLRFAVGLKRRVAPAELREALRHTGVAHCADLPARVLSAGQRRRVAMARVLAMRASLWLLDEPFANLDAQGSELVSELLRSHVLQGGMAVIVAHQELAIECPLRRLELHA
jgi:heme exporter protein A